MTEERPEEEAPALWPPFMPDLRLLADMEKGRPKKELEAILEKAERRRREREMEKRPEKPT